jgi:hypothetical protein
MNVAAFLALLAALGGQEGVQDLPGEVSRTMMPSVGRALR